MFFKIILASVSILFSSLVVAELEVAEPVWIDVRTALEHRLDSIEGDTRITHSEILSKVSDVVVDKDTEIHLYCRSGARSGKAMAELIEAGYTNVHNAGGINDAREQRGLTENND